MWSTSLSPSPASKTQAPAVSDTAREMDPMSPVRAEDPDSPRSDVPLEDAILARLDDDKAQEIVLIDLKGKSPMADTMIVASGRSQRHVGALADHLLRLLKEHGLGKAKVEGLPHCDWVLIDAGDVIVHLFRPEVRSFYNIEKIWSVDSAHRTQSA